MKKAMLDSDITISASGQTLYELARVGVPTIAISVSDNQMNNVRGWQKAGFIEYAGWWQDDKLLTNVLVCINNLRKKGIRLKKSLIGRKFVDGKGCHRIVDYLLNKR